MAEFPKQPTPTVDSIYKMYEQKNGDWRRDHLGASQIGHDCERKLWYDFIWCSEPNFEGRMRRLFQTGFKEEARIIEELRATGITVYSVDPYTGKQIHYDDFGGHFSGSLDGVALGFPEAPKTYHVLEIKTTNTKAFNALKKSGVAATKPQHYSQMQTYMRWAGLDRAMYLSVCKETDFIYEERVYYDDAVAMRLKSKAERIVFSSEPPHKFGTPENFECKWCSHKKVCHENKLPLISCRVCSFANAEENGKWICTREGRVLSSLDQRKACPKHCFVPGVVPLEVTDASDEKGIITYGDITNGFGHTLSKDLQGVIDGIRLESV
jgi:hypothetical protein